MRYALKTLSENGFHNLALSKANGFGCGTWEYMLSHNATTHWERYVYTFVTLNKTSARTMDSLHLSVASWWRSENLYSHNHPMLGASAEWMVSAVAGLELHPHTTGGRLVRFWPRFPNSAETINHAWAIQGTPRGDFAVAWRFEDLPEENDDTAIVKIRIRLFVPPDGRSVFRLPEYGLTGKGVDWTIKHATEMPDMENTKELASNECNDRRRAKEGFNYNWEFLREEKTWAKVFRKKAIGTACTSHLFHPSLDGVIWSSRKSVSGVTDNGVEVELGPGLYDVMVDEWQLKPEVKGSTSEWRIASMKQFTEAEDVGPYCADLDTFGK